MIGKKPVFGLDPAMAAGFPAFAMPASAGEGSSEEISSVTMPERKSLRSEAVPLQILDHIMPKQGSG
jgi:hypothetical protein